MKVEAAVESAHRGPVAHRIASGADWSIENVVCDLGPNDRPSHERFNRTTIAAVLARTFECGTRSKKALLYPGSFLLGNAGSHFECGHDHGGGDHCVAFHFDTALFEEIASSAAGAARFLGMSPRSLRAGKPPVAAALPDRRPI